MKAKLSNFVSPFSASSLTPREPTQPRPCGALPWPGGKSWLVPKLIQMLPRHRCYCEVFGGAAALLLSKPRSEVEVYNDRSTELVNLFRVARFHRDELIRELEYLPNSRAEFFEFDAQPGMTDIQRAARWFYRVSVCFGGSSLDSFGVSKICGGAAMGSRLGRINRLGLLNQRLDNVCIENLDWRECLTRYDGPETFFFLDPPYTLSDVKIYSAWKDQDMRELCLRIAGLKAKWILTVNDSPANREIFGSFKIRTVSRRNGIENRPGHKRAPVYRELVIVPPLLKPLASPLQPPKRPSNLCKSRIPVYRIPQTSGTRVEAA